MSALLRVVGAAIALFVLVLVAITFGLDPRAVGAATAVGLLAFFRMTRQPTAGQPQTLSEHLLETPAAATPNLTQVEAPISERGFASIDTPPRSRWPVAWIVAALVVLVGGAHWALVSEIDGLTRDTLANWLKDKPYVISRIDVPLTALFSSSYQLSVTLQGSSDANSLAILRPTVDGFCLIGGCTEAISGDQLLVLTMSPPS